MDPTGEVPLLIPALIGLTSTGLGVYDTYKTLTDPCLTGAQKGMHLAAGAVLSAVGLKSLHFVGKHLYSAGKYAANFSQKQLAKKFKHASDFGVKTTKKNPKTIAEFQSAITNHLGDAATVQKGTYGFVKDSKVFFNPKTNNTVVLDKTGDFVTGFKLSPGTKQFENFMNNGVLR